VIDQIGSKCLPAYCVPACSAKRRAALLPAIPSMFLARQACYCPIQLDEQVFRRCSNGIYRQSCLAIHRELRACQRACPQNSIVCNLVSCSRLFQQNAWPTIPSTGLPVLRVDWHADNHINRCGPSITRPLPPTPLSNSCSGGCILACACSRAVSCPALSR
jgi:hypothetical protein